MQRDHDERIFWKCQQCGDCCRNLLTSNPRGLEGMMLFPAERGLFSKKVVYPIAAIGKGKRAPRSDRIVLFQMGAKCCPHLSQDNRCQIYPRRPLGCRSYPFIGTYEGRINVRDNKCRGANSLGASRFLIDRDHYEDIVDFSRRLPLPLSATWLFDLEYAKWKRIEPLMSVSEQQQHFASYEQFVASGGIQIAGLQARQVQRALEMNRLALNQKEFT